MTIRQKIQLGIGFYENKYYYLKNSTRGLICKEFIEDYFEFDISWAPNELSIIVSDKPHEDAYMFVFLPVQSDLYVDELYIYLSNHAQWKHIEISDALCKYLRHELKPYTPYYFRVEYESCQRGK